MNRTNDKTTRLTASARIRRELLQLAQQDVFSPGTGGEQLRPITADAISANTIAFGQMFIPTGIANTPVDTGHAAICACRIRSTLRTRRNDPPTYNSDPPIYSRFAKKEIKVKHT